MKKINFTRKAIIQAAAVGVASVCAVLFCVSQNVGIGQSYQEVSVDGEIVGYVAKQVDVGEAFREARRELSLETGARVCVDMEWESASSRELFQKLLSASELKSTFKGMIEEENATGKVRVYTVAIDGYRANFTALEDVETFLNRVKESADTEQEYTAEINKNDSHISGILSAILTETNTSEAEDADVVAESTTEQGKTDANTETVDTDLTSGDEKAVSVAGVLRAGVNARLVAIMEEGAVVAENESEATATGDTASDSDYETGILDIEFVEEIEVYENYVEADEVSDIEEQVIEVTKEKESNKIYVVESGDCLSVIAMDHDTTVSSIVALNGLSGADAMIRDGQELIVAVPEPDLKIRITMGEVYEEDYTAEPVIIENDSWYTTKEVVHQEGTTGHRERNDVVVYENGIEVSRELIHENVLEESEAAVIERGTIIPPTYIKPLAGGRYTSGFGRRWGRMHEGVDWACPVGTTVYASCGGTVIQASYNGGYGNNVVISHPDGRLTRYAHNSKLLVRVGQYVEQGEPIALSGNTGRSTGPHVHFEIYINGSPVNPLKYISY